MLSAFSAAALVSCVQAAPSLVGKRLVLELPSGEERCYDFSQNHEQRRTVENHDSYHSFDAGKGEFYEESRVLGTTVRGGYGYTRWRLDFATPTTGTATLVKKHPRVRTLRVGVTVPFKTETLPES